ncbi:hypothetical protein KY285_016530 [Solanum tuberosum]|nr:hypothetical protein KY284_016542 [Solanum tuberosum]KAH0685994.1 hypothetical protein KY284_016547 [Solanum tuberosum]KAH0688036.1 hypothetical protein KY284_018589 [Solanum tuberosum]KAH0702252.1 hypothetical protein KY285_016530 [Solanum tuberosum]
MYIQKANSISDQLSSLQHPINEDDLVEYVKCGLSLSYRPFTWSIDATQFDVSFDTLYGLLLTEERQLKNEESAIIVTTAHYGMTQPQRGRDRGRGNGNGNRGRDRGGYFAAPSPPGRGFATSVHICFSHLLYYRIH